LSKEKYPKEKTPVLVQSCDGQAFLPCPVLIRHPWLSKTERDVHVALSNLFQKSLPATHLHMG